MTIIDKSELKCASLGTFSLTTHRIQQPGQRPYDCKFDVHNNIINILIRVVGWVTHTSSPEESRDQILYVISVSSTSSEG